MIAIDLFDVVVKISSHRPASIATSPRVQGLAVNLVETCLSDWRLLREFSPDLMPDLSEDRSEAIERLRETHLLYSHWARTAEDVLSRVRSLLLDGANVPGSEELEDALGLTRARLMSTPEGVDRAMEQVRHGQTIPAKELRDELNARIHAGRQVAVAGA